MSWKTVRLIWLIVMLALGAFIMLAAYKRFPPVWFVPLDAVTLTSMFVGGVVFAGRRRA